MAVAMATATATAGSGVQWSAGPSTFEFVTRGVVVGVVVGVLLAGDQIFRVIRVVTRRRRARFAPRAPNLV